MGAGCDATSMFVYLYLVVYVHYYLILSLVRLERRHNIIVAHIKINVFVPTFVYSCFGITGSCEILIIVPKMIPACSLALNLLD